MKIGAISELSSLTDSFDTIKTEEIGTYSIEVSKKVDGIYTSYKYDFGKYSQDISAHLQHLSNAITALTADTADIRGSYVRLSGDTMTGALIFANNIAGYAIQINGYNGINSPNANHLLHNNIEIKDTGTLYCRENDIHGCALTAKWA